MAEPQEGESENERLYLEARRAEGFGLRSKVGRWWAAAIKNGPELRASYAPFGRQRPEQRAFRQQWALAKADLCN